MLTHKSFFVFALAMTLVVVLSNFLVQFPVTGTVFGIELADLLTWGAFSYPLAFLVNDLSNRQHGPRMARRVVYVGFFVGVLISFWTSMPRIAIASGTAFLIGQLLDIAVFNHLRRQSWWRAPLAGSVLGSIIDTLLFFSIAFSASFAFIAPGDAFAAEWAPLLGVFALEAPRWLSWAAGDLLVKIIAGVVLLLPYGALMSVVKPMPPAGKPSLNPEA